MRKCEYKGKEFYFHQFGIETKVIISGDNLSYTGTTTNTVAIIEDCLCGNIIQVPPSEIKFLESPESTKTEVHCYDGFGEIINQGSGEGMVIKPGQSFIDALQEYTNRSTKIAV